MGSKRFDTERSEVENLVCTRVCGLVTEHMQVPVQVNICPVPLKKVLNYVQSLTYLPCATEKGT